MHNEERESLQGNWDDNKYGTGSWHVLSSLETRWTTQFIDEIALTQPR